MNFEPAIYEHAARIIGKTPWEVSRNVDLLVDAHAAAFERYGHTPVVPGVDIYNLEAEAYGAVVVQPEGNNIPSFREHLCSETAEIPDLPELDPASSGRIPMVIHAAVELKKRLPSAMIRVPVSGPFSLAANLCGLENLLCDAMTEEESVRQALDKLTEGQVHFCRAIAAAGIGITLFESAATPPLVPPPMFSDLVLPSLKHLFDQAKTVSDDPPACIIGGNTAPILEAMLETGTRYVICPGETDQAAFMNAMNAHPEVTVRINMNPAVFCKENPSDALAEADRVAALATGRERVCIGSGVLPYEACTQTVHQVKHHLKNKE